MWWGTFGFLGLIGDNSSLFDPVTNWVQFGILGLLVMAFLTGWILPKPAHVQIVKQLEDQRDTAVSDKVKAEAQRDAALAIAQEKLIPMLYEFTSTAKALIPILQDKAAVDRMNSTQRRESRQRDERD